MKTATMPSLRVEEPLRQSIENMLSTGETLSSFMEEALRMNLARRQARQEFVARGLASREEAKNSGEYLSSEAVLQSLDGLLASATSTLAP